MKTATKQETKKEFKLEEAFALWVHKSKKGTEYLSGYDLHKNNLVAFYNSEKKNPKEPDVRVYKQVEEKNVEVASLWVNVGNNDKKYLTGTTDEKEKLVGFFNKEEDSKKPYIRVYFKED